jgi:hypothetical protein
LHKDKYSTLESLIAACSSDFLHTSKSELGIFWLSDDLTEIIHFRTILDCEYKNPVEFCLRHYNEWSSRSQEISGNYNDCPRGRIFYQNNRYSIEVNCPIDKSTELLVCEKFSLPRAVEEWNILTCKLIPRPVY